MAYEQFSFNACNCSIFSFLEASARKKPNGVAIKYFGTEITFAQLLSDVKKAAASLISLGVKNGDSVVICLPNIPEALIAIYAVNAIGAVCHMVHYISTNAEIKKVVYSSKCKTAFCYKNSEKSFDGLDVTLITCDVAQYIKKGFSAISANKSLKDLRNRAHYCSAHVKRKIPFSAFLNRKSEDAEKITFESRNGSEPCTVLYEYSDNKMKNGIILSNLSINVVAHQIQQAFEHSFIEKGILNVMPVYQSIGFAMCMHTAVSASLPQVLLPEFKSKLCCDTILSAKPDMIFLAPSFFEEIIKERLLENKNLSFIKVIGSIGNYQHQKLKIMMNELLKDGKSSARFISGYGRLECAGVCSLELPYDGGSSGGCVGVALPGDDIKVIDRITGECITDIDGEICISSASLSRGYYNNMYETSRRIRTHDDGKIWFSTGDIGKITGDGVLYFRQGGNRVLNVSGYRIYPSCVEDEICSVDNVITSCVVNDTDSNGAPIVTALVVPDASINLPSKESKLREKITETVTENLNCMSAPKKIAFASNLPLGKNGNISYSAVRDYINEKC